MTKRKILFVVSDFFQGGAERYAYEIDKAINKNEFQISILCLNKKHANTNSWNRFYDKMHEKLGTKIVYFDDFINHKNLLFQKIKIRLRLKLAKPIIERKYFNFLNEYDLIHWMGEYTFYRNLPKYLLKKSLVNVMSAKFQNPKLYKGFDFNYKYNIISGFTNKEFDFEFNQFKSINHFFFPLVFEIENKNALWKYNDTTNNKIGIFTRLDKYKPLAHFFYAFQLLLDKLPNSELHIFGTGNPDEEGYSKLVESLQLKDRVFFRGHQENIKETALKEKINLSWFLGYNNNRPAGYAGFDICSIGVPLLCWDFFNEPITFKNEVYPHFKNLNNFVNESYFILTDKNKAESLSEKQFNDVSKNRDVSKKINDIENLYNEIINNNNEN